jgi:fibronectin-binding autotransporter adhesin
MKLNSPLRRPVPASRITDPRAVLRRRAKSQVCHKRRTTALSFALAVAACVLLLGVPMAAQAQTFTNVYWDVDGNTNTNTGGTGLWNGTATNWNTNPLGGIGGFAVVSGTNGSTSVTNPFSGNFIFNFGGTSGTVTQSSNMAYVGGVKFLTTGYVWLFSASRTITANGNNSAASTIDVYITNNANLNITAANGFGATFAAMGINGGSGATLTLSNAINIINFIKFGTGSTNGAKTNSVNTIVNASGVYALSTDNGGFLQSGNITNISTGVFMISNSSSGDITVSGLISGTGALTIQNSSSGKLFLGAANTYSGGTILTNTNSGSGYTGISNSSAFGTGTITSSPGVATNEIRALANALTITNNIATVSGSLRLGTSNSGHLSTWSGVISGAGSIYYGLSDTGLYLTGTNNSFGGGFTNGSSGVLYLTKLGMAGANSSVGTNGTLTVGLALDPKAAGSFRWIGGADETSDKNFVMGATNATAGLKIFNDGTNTNTTLTLNGTISANASNKIVTLGGYGTNTLVMNGRIIEAASSTNSLIILSGNNGTVVLNNTTNQIGGGVTISNNATNGVGLTVLSVTNIGTAGNASVLGTNGNITIGGSSSTTNRLRYTGSAGETNNKSITMAGSNCVISLEQAGSNDLKFSGLITNTTNTTLELLGSTTGTGEIAGSISQLADLTVSVRKEGTGVWTLSSSNSHSGETTINGGSLVVTHANALGTTNGGTTVNAGGALTFSNLNIGAEALTLASTGTNNNGGLRSVAGSNTYGGTVAVNGTSSIGVDAGSLTLTNTLSGSSLLTKVGAGSLVLSAGSSSFSGGMTISNGTAVASNSTALGTGGATVSSNGILVIAAGITKNNITNNGTVSIGATASLSADSLGAGNTGVLAIAGSVGNQATFTSTGVAGTTNSSTPLGLGSLTLTGYGTLNLQNAYNTLAATGAVSISGSGNIFNISGIWDAGQTYTLLSGSSLSASGMQLTGSPLGAASIGFGSSNTVGRTTYLFDSNSTSLFMTVSGGAGNITWNTNSGLWDTDTNNTPWTNDVGGSGSAFYSGDSVTLGTPASTIGLDAAGILAGSVAVNNGSGMVTLTNGTLTADTFAKSGAGSVTLSNALVVSGVLSNSAGGLIAATNVTALSLNLSGGTTTISGSNSFGSANISGGSVTLGGPSIVTNNLTISGNASLTLGASSAVSNAMTLTSGSISGAGTTMTAASYAVSSGSIGANLAGGGALTKSTAGTVTLSGTNTYSGGTTVSAGTLAYGANDALANAGAVTINSGTLDIASYSDTVGAVILTNGTITGTSGVLTGSSYLAAGASASSVSAILGGSGTLTKTNGGTLTLSGANTYSGATAISGGTLALSSAGSIISSAVTVADGATFDISGISAGGTTIATLQGGSVVNATHLVVLGAKTLTFGDSSSSNSFYGVISGTGGLVKVGTGTITLYSNSTYSGGFTLSNGLVRLATSGQLATNAGQTNIVSTGFGTGTLNLAGGRIVSSGSSSRTIYNSVNLANDFSLGDTISSNAGTITVSAAVSGATTTLLTNVSVTTDSPVVWEQVIGGAYALTKLGAGTLILSNANTYTGGTVITAGTLSLGNAGTTGSLAGNITNNATLLVARTGDTTITNAISGTGALTNYGAGTLTLSGSNTYSGLTTTATNSVLRLGSSNALGSTAAGTVVSSASAIDLNGQTTGAEALTISGTGVSASGVIFNSSASAASWSGLITPAATATIKATNGSITLSGGIDLNNSATNRTLTLDGAGGLTLSGNISNSVASATNGIAIAATATNVTLSGSNSYTGTTTISTTGGLNINSAYAISTNTLITGTGSFLNNTSGGAVTNLGNNNITLADTLTFGTTGSTSANNLNLGTGTTTVGSSRTIGLAGTGVTLTLGTLDSTSTVSGRTFTATNTVGSSGNTIALAGWKIQSGSLSNVTAKLAGDANWTISGPIVNGNVFSNGVQIDATGLTTFGGNNTYDGTTSISTNATLRITSATGLGSTNTGTTVDAGGQLQLSGGITVDAGEALSLSGTNGATASLRNISGANTYNGAITFNTGTNRIDSDAGTLTLSSFANTVISNRWLLVGGAGNTIFTGRVTGNNSGSVVKDGAGTLTLANTNNEVGPTGGVFFINNGTLALGTNNALAARPVVVNGGTLDISTFTNTVSAVTLTNGTISGSSGVLTGSSFASGGENLTNTFRANLAGSGGVSLTGNSNTTLLSGSNTYSGTNSLNDGAAGTNMTLRVTSVASLSSNSSLLGASALARIPTLDLATNGAYTMNSYQGGNIIFLATNGAATLSFTNISTGNSSIEGSRYLYATNVGLTFAGGIDISPTTTNKSFGFRGNGDYTFNGSIVTTNTTYTADIAVETTGVVTFNASNNYNGTTTVASNATLLLGNNYALGTTNNGTTVLSGGVLDLGGRSVGDEALLVEGTGVSSGGAMKNSSASSASFSGTVTLSNATTIATTNGNITLSGAIGDAGAARPLTKTGSSTLTLSGADANTYTGLTTVSGGTLQLNKTAGVNALASTNITVNSGATLLLSANNQVVNDSLITLSGGTITRASGVSEVFGNLILTTGSFLDFGSGTQGNLTFGTYAPSSLLTVNNFFGGNTLIFGSDLTGSIAVGTYDTTSYTSADGLFTINSISGGFTTGYSGGSFTITAIPETSTVVAVLGLIGLCLWPLRRRMWTCALLRRS